MKNTFNNNSFTSSLKSSTHFAENMFVLSSYVIPWMEKGDKTAEIYNKQKWIIVMLSLSHHYLITLFSAFC